MSWSFLFITGALVWVSKSSVCEDPAGLVSEAVCCAHCEDFRMGTLDRQIHLFLAFCGVFLNVVPKYVKKDEAERHLVIMKKHRWWNPLMIHILGGIFTVLPAGLAGVFGWHGPKMMNFISFWSLVHDISIYGLLKNHDGIWAIRAGNLFLAIVKTVVVLNVKSAEAKADLLFLFAFGFMGTRIMCSVWYIITHLALPSSLIDEYWYSGGLAAAQFYIYIRTWSVSGSVLYMSFIFAAMLTYHKRWNRRYQAVFVLSMVAMCAISTIALAGDASGQIWLMFVFYLITVKLPFWRRQRMSTATAFAKRTMKCTVAADKVGHKMASLARLLSPKPHNEAEAVIKTQTTHPRTFVFPATPPTPKPQEKVGEEKQVESTAAVTLAAAAMLAAVAKPAEAPAAKPAAATPRAATPRPNKRLVTSSIAVMRPLKAMKPIREHAEEEFEVENEGVNEGASVEPVKRVKQRRFGAVQLGKIPAHDEPMQNPFAVMSPALARRRPQVPLGQAWRMVLSM